MTLFELEKLTYYYPGTKTPALNGVSLSVDEGDLLLIAGPSGGGKTTLLRALCGMVPSLFGGRIGGRVSYRGERIEDIERRRLHSEIGMVLQDPDKQILMTGVERELALGPENLGLPPATIRRRVMETASSLGLSGILSSKNDQLSCGLLQRVAVGSVLTMGPRILLLDEPTSQLDPVAAQELLDLLKRLRDDLGCAVIMAEQRIESCLPVADRVVFIDGGAVRFDGAPPAFCRWARGPAPQFLPPVAKLFHSDKPVPIPLTVREARKILASKSLIKPAAGRPPAGGETAAALDRVAFSYADKMDVLKGINFRMRRGEIVSILGPNGAGKSTLLKIICGVIRPGRGAVTVLGRDPASFDSGTRARFFGYVPQNLSDMLFCDTVRDEVGYVLRALERHSGEKVRAALERWELLQQSERNPRELSVGERQSVALAAATIADPPLILLDEPTRGQDPLVKERLGRRLSLLALDKNAAVAVVTQDIEFAAEWSGRVVILSGGEIIADGPPCEVFDGGPFYSPQISRLFRGFVEGVITVSEALEALGDGAQPNGKPRWTTGRSSS